MGNKFQELLAAKNAEIATSPSETAPSSEPDYSKYAELIPQAEARSESDIKDNQTIDEIVERLGIIGAYKEFIGKMEPKPGRKTEGIHISCPLPWHADKNPSAWVNTIKNTWFCSGCSVGGDIYDLAAIGLGFDLNTYKENQFVELRRAIAEHFGYAVFSSPGEKDFLYRPTIESEDVETDVPAFKSAEPTAPTTAALFDKGLEEKIEAELSSSDKYTLNWREIVKPGTFLDIYMQACTKDFNVEEFHFWNALIALSMAIGRNVYANDTPSVYGNLFICLMGGSGSGKTKSQYPMEKLINKVMPFEIASDYPLGVKEIPQPGSGEYLISKFSHPVYGVDPIMGKQIIIDYAPIRGVIRFGEFASLRAITNRSGSDLASRLLEFYDCKDRISTGSRLSGDTIAHTPYACATTTTQPKSLSRLLSQADEDSGFLNRWLFVGGRNKKGKFWGEVKVDLREAELELFKIHAWASEEREVSLSSEAEWQANRDLVNFIVPDKDKHDPALGRMDLTIKKLCLLLAVNEMSTTITLDIYDRVMKMYEYIKAYAIFRQEFLKEESYQAQTDTTVVSKIEQFYSENESWPTSRELLRYLGTRNIRGSQELVRTLDSLIKVGVLETEVTRVGRPTTRYAIIREK